MFRRSARCTNCGRKGAALQHPSWAGKGMGGSRSPARRVRARCPRQRLLSTIAAVSICSNVRVKKPDLLDQLVGAGAQHRGNGDAERSTNPILTGSLPAMKTMGIVVVAAFAAISAPGTATMTETGSRARQPIGATYLVESSPIDIRQRHSGLRRSRSQPILEGTPQSCEETRQRA
jgi:hypothetical protein